MSTSLKISVEEQARPLSVLIHTLVRSAPVCYNDSIKVDPLVAFLGSDGHFLRDYILNILILKMFSYLHH